MSLTMSPAYCRALESGMCVQIYHKTHQRMEHNAKKAQMRHTQEWYYGQAGPTAA